MKLSDLKIFEEAFSNLPVFKEHPLYRTELTAEDEHGFDGYRYEWQVRDDDNKIIGVLINPYHNEEYLVKYAKELTVDQIKIILDEKYSYLFQNGVPHHSWNTDRFLIMSAIIKAQGTIITTKTWRETWTKNTFTWYKLECGLIIQCLAEEPFNYSFDSLNYSFDSRTTHRYKVVEEKDVPVVPTHIAVTFFSDGYDSININKHFSGSHDECVEWVRTNAKTNLWAILDAETYRKNYTE